MKRLVTWPDVNYIHEPGSCNFQDGVLDLERTHLDAWERDLEGVWEVSRHPAKAGTWLPAEFHPSESGPYEDGPEGGEPRGEVEEAALTQAPAAVKLG